MSQWERVAAPGSFIGLGSEILKALGYDDPDPGVATIRPHPQSRTTTGLASFARPKFPSLTLG